MATILGLALKVTGDASGLAKSLDPVDRALASIGKQVENATRVFAPFAAASAAAAAAQQEFAARFAELSEQLRAGALTPQQFAEAFAKLKDEAKGSADAFSEGVRVTEKYRTEGEKLATELDRIAELLRQGAISEETAARARADISGANDEAARAERARADALADASRIIRANLTPQEQYDNQIQALRTHLEEGRLSQEQFNRAAERAKSDLDRAGKSAGDADKNIERLNRNVRFLAQIEIGRAIVDGFQVLSRTFTSIGTQITGLASSVNSSLDTLNDFSARTGIGVEALQGYSLAAKLAGVDTEQFGAALQKLSVNIGKAAPGDALDKSLRGINLSVAELRALSPEQQFSAIGQAISQLPTAADRAAAAVQVFGKSGAALAPLFKQGADSIEELRARAERLGVIVDQTQVNNVAEMNDGFDLVGATINGIIGQVEGNLAPVITDVTNQFLRFVEEWSGAQGTGGTGIANLITDVLLDGAEYFAGIFDEFIGSFTGISTQLEAVGDTFSTVSGVLETLSGIFKSIFNTFEIIGNGIAVALGKVLEAIGSYVSQDLEDFGKNLQTNANEQLQGNLADLEEAGKQIISGVNEAVFGNEQERESAAAGAAESFIRAMRERVERERSPAFKIETNIEETRDRFDAFFGGIVDQSSEITEAMRGFESAVADVSDPMNMTAEEIERIKDAQEKVNELLDKELQSRQDTAEAAAKQAEEDSKRIENLLKSSDAQTKLQQDITAVEREQLRVQAELEAARAVGDKQRADAAAAKLAQYDQLEASLRDQEQALGQGFGQGFQDAFAAIDEDINNLINKASEFGNSGALAAQELQDGIARAQEQARAGILSKDALDTEVARLKGLFDQQLQGAANVQQLLFANLGQEQQARLQFIQQEQQAREQAAQNVAAIEREIEVTKNAIAAAREGGDLQAARAGVERLNQLNQIAAQEKAIADGRVAREQEISQLRQQQIAEAQRQQEEFFKAQQAAQQQFLQERARVAEERRKAEEAEFARQEERLRGLNTLGEQVVNTADARTSAGQDLILGLAANAQDPALIEARLQTKALQNLSVAVAQVSARYFSELNLPVAIVGGARLG